MLAISEMSSTHIASYALRIRISVMSCKALNLETVASPHVFLDMQTWVAPLLVTKALLHTLYKSFLLPFRGGMLHQFWKLCLQPPLLLMLFNACYEYATHFNASATFKLYNV